MPKAINEGTPTLIFGFLNAYPFAIVVGMLLSIATVAYFWKREKYKWDHLLTMIIIIIPTSIIGARLWFIAERLIYNFSDPFPGGHWYAIWNGGLAVQGGVIVSALSACGYVYSKKNEIDFWKAVGMILPTVLLGQAIGRWGNYGNHEVFGAVTTRESISWLGSTIADNMFIKSAGDTVGKYRIPLFFYESTVNLFGYLVIVWIFVNLGTFKPGLTGGFYLLWYGIVRVSMEPLREEQYVLYIIVAVLQIFVGIILIGYLQFFSKTEYVVTKNKIFKTYNSKWWIESKQTKGYINE